MTRRGAEEPRSRGAGVRPYTLHPRPYSRRSGQALVPVLFVVLILTAFAVTVSTTAMRETRAASNTLRTSQAYYAAKAAVYYAAAQLTESTNQGATIPTITPPPDTDANGWTQLGDCWYRVDIIDTASRLNINTATVDTIAKLPTLQNHPEVAAAIVDWRTTGENPTTFQGATGAKSDYYQALNPPYSCKDAPFDSVNELLLVRGITPTMLFGAPDQNQNQNPNQNPPGMGDDLFDSGGMFGRASHTRQTGGAGGAGQASSSQPAVDTSQSTIPMSELVTTFSRERNVASDGTARVNILTASQSDLTNAGLSAQLARQIVQNRGTNGASIKGIADLMGPPFSGFTRSVMQQIADKLTATSSQYRDGVVNINTAPAEVLACLPGVDANVYNAVIQARRSGTVFNGMNDLFQLTSLNRQQLQTLVDRVCTKSSIYTMRVRVRVPGMQRLYTAEAVVDLAGAQTASTSGGTGTSQTPDTGTGNQQSYPMPSIVQWREVGRYPGWSTWIAPPTYVSTATQTTTGTSGGTGGSSH